MKKILSMAILFATAAVAAMTVASCSKAEDGGSLIGKWNTVSDTDEDGNISYYNEGEMVVEFKKDQSFTISEFGEQTGYGNYNYDASTKDLHMARLDEVWGLWAKVSKLSKTELVLDNQDYTGSQIVLNRLD